ncbi:MAG: squalene/phytoene synthase family protein [Gemmobacter sp.]|nr:squalene/phytoene synthase family protein [Gemmobacter sp.]
MSVSDCIDLVEKGDPDRFFVTRAATAQAQAVLFPLYALNIEIARAAWASDQPLIAEMRLQWWRDALDEIAQGKTVRGHPVLLAVAPVIRDHALPVTLFDAMAEARRWDIWTEPFDDSAALLTHLDATSGNLNWAACLALGGPAKAEQAIRDFALAAGLAGWFRAVPALIGRGRDPLPGGAEAVAGLAQTGLDRLRQARAARASVPRACTPALLAGWQAGGILAQAAAEPGRVEAGALGTSEFARRGGLVWRALTGLW